MLNFDEFAEIFYPNIKADSFEYKHLESEYGSQVARVQSIDKRKEVETLELIQKLFPPDNIKITSQTSFYRLRRTYARLMQVDGFNFKTVLNLNKIEFKDVYNVEDFSKEWFKDLNDLFNEIDNIQRAERYKNREGAKALAGLMWSGLSFVEASELKLENMNLSSEKGGTIYVNRLNKRTKTTESRLVNIQPEVSKAILVFLRNRKGGVHASEYVFAGKNGQRCHITTTNKMITQLTSSDATDRVFISQNIENSGLFYRVYKGYETLNTNMPDIQYKYDTWLDVFYNIKGSA